MVTKKKVALVTGASRGIGRATAKALAAQGAHVILHYRNGLSEVESLAAEIHAIGGSTDIVKFDLALPDGPHLLAAEVIEISGGQLDILVSNAGLGKVGDIDSYKVDDLDQLYAINFRASFFLLQQLIPALVKGSTVILVSSLVARASADALAAYAATKGAIETMVRHFASALGADGIRVNAVAPGVIETDMASFTKSPEGHAMTLSMQALQRIGQPEDVADVIAFLASDSARWIDGAVIPVDGGSRL